MLSSVLKSAQAVQVNVLIMRAFVRMRRAIADHSDVLKKPEELEQKYDQHDGQIAAIFDALKRLIEPAQREVYQIGFASDAGENSPSSKHSML